jgi:hypothetical protein
MMNEVRGWLGDRFRLGCSFERPATRRCVEAQLEENIAFSRCLYTLSDCEGSIGYLSFVSAQSLIEFLDLCKASIVKIIIM